jgi:hypothetical protein
MYDEYHTLYPMAATKNVTYLWQTRDPTGRKVCLSGLFNYSTIYVNNLQEFFQTNIRG